MAETDIRKLGEYNTVPFKTATGTGAGLLLGTITGAIKATWQDIPAVQRNQAMPALMKTGKIMGAYGLLFAAIGGVFSFTDAMAEELRGKKDIWNGVYGGAAAGSILGLRVGRLPIGVGAAAAFAAMSAAVDASGQVTRTPTDREFLPFARGATSQE
eukprot:jgi/Mesen1/3603/ME000020S03135